MTHLWASKQERRAPANQKAPESEKGSEASRGKLGGDPEKGRRNQSKEKPYWVVHFSLWKRPSLGSFPRAQQGRGRPRTQVTSALKDSGNWLRWGSSAAGQAGGFPQRLQTAQRISQKRQTAAASALDTLIPLVRLRLPGGSPVLSASVSVVTHLANGVSAARDMVLKVDTVFSIVSTFASQKTDKANKPLTAPD